MQHLAYILADSADTLIGGFIGFFSSFVIMLITRWLDRKGKLRIYAKRTAIDEERKWGFHEEGGQSLLVVPLKLEFQNTTGRSLVVRNVDVVPYRKGKDVARTVQIEYKEIEQTVGRKVTEVKTSEYGEEDAHNSYSFTLPPNSIVNKKCLFCLKHENVPDFDELRLDYFDERDRRISLHIGEIAGDWKPLEFEPDLDWMLLKKR